MRKIILSIIVTAFALSGYTQNHNWVAFDTNGPMGECLFPQNEQGEIIYTEVIPCSMSSDSIMGLAKEFIYDISKRYKADCKIELEGLTKLGCKIEIPVGKNYFSVGVWGTGNIGTWERPQSEIKFNLVIDIREGKYRYTLNNFYTERRRIPGEGKSDGPSNIIHWQRVNSLTKEMPRKESERAEYERMIELEKAIYQAEYNAVQDVIKGLQTFTQIEDF